MLIASKGIARGIFLREKGREKSQRAAAALIVHPPIQDAVVFSVESVVPEEIPRNNKVIMCNNFYSSRQCFIVKYKRRLTVMMVVLMMMLNVLY